MIRVANSACLAGESGGASAFSFVGAPLPLAASRCAMHGKPGCTAATHDMMER